MIIGGMPLSGLDFDFSVERHACKGDKMKKQKHCLASWRRLKTLVGCTYSSGAMRKRSC
jgi:hypothetical protein